jgi:hypothetical protein
MGAVVSARPSEADASGAGLSAGGVELPHAKATEDTTIRAIIFKLLICDPTLRAMLRIKRKLPLLPLGEAPA